MCCLSLWSLVSRALCLPSHCAPLRWTLRRGPIGLLRVGGATDSTAQSKELRKGLSMSGCEDFPESNRVELLDSDEECFEDCKEGPKSDPIEFASAPVAMERAEVPSMEDTSLLSDLQEKLHTFDELDIPLEPQSSQTSSALNAFAVEKDILRAQTEKERGNEFFRNKDYDNAIQCYSNAIDLCPVDDEHKEAMAIFYGNRAAAYAADDETELVIEDCSAALELQPSYLKVLVRRMQMYEKLDKVDDALSDAKRIQEIDSSFPKIQTIINRLQKLSEERMNKMKDEAMSKLKELGNSILGNFGMSLDNFKMQQDPSSGSWSISMNK